MRMLLAADIGGTKTLLGLFEPAASRPRPIAVRAFGTVDYPDLPSMIAEFIGGESVKAPDIEAASFGVAGPVIDEAATLTNVPWQVDLRSVRLKFHFAICRISTSKQLSSWIPPALALN